MPRYIIADLTVDIDSSNEKLLARGEKYQTLAGGTADITIPVSQERINRVYQKYPQLSYDEWEYQLAGFSFSDAILDFDGFCLHSSALAMDGRAVLFSAPCGTGKSTHTGLWQEYFGPDKVAIINDDKPALRLMDGVFTVYGTPWSGKSELNANIKAPLQAVVFLEQAAENHIRRLNSREATQMLVYQGSRSKDADKMDRLLFLIDALIKRIPVYKMVCNITTDAVITAHGAIYAETKEASNH